MLQKFKITTQSVSQERKKKHLNLMPPHVPASSVFWDNVQSQ